MPLTHLNPPTVYPPARNAYSVAVVSTGSRHVHLSGVVGRNKDGKHEGDGGMAAQMRTCMDNVVKILEAAGAKPEHVVRMSIHTTDIQRYIKEGDPERNRHFTTGKLPTGTLVEITRLADPQALIEVTVDAVMD
jgi:enamine deaminase RidA (YjgF/YER057c/UK114 family)